MCAGGKKIKANGTLNSKVPLIQEVAADPSPDTRLNDPRTSWVLAAPSRPHANRLPRSARVANGAPTISSETAPVENKSRFSYSTTEPTFLFSRRARAFRTYFIQQLDDYQFLTPFTNRSSSSTRTSSADLTHAPSDLSPPLPTSIDDSSAETTPQSNNESFLSNVPSSDPGLQLPSLNDMWQQACRATLDLWRHAKNSPTSPSRSLVQWSTKYLQPSISSDRTTEHPKNLTPHFKDPKSEMEVGPGVSTTPDNSHLQPNDQSTDAANGQSSELRGSCMAVVIGLVAGIIWF